MFDYPNRAALLDGGWDFAGRTASGAARDTESSSRPVGYGGAGVSIPAGPGDLWEGANDTTNTMFRDLPATWSRTEVSLSFAPGSNFQHAGIVVYDDDDDYLELSRAFNSFAGGQGIAMIDERAGRATDLPRLATTATELRLRLDRTPGGALIGSVSTDAGATWRTVGSVTRTFDAPRLAINVAGSTSGAPAATIRSVTITTGGAD
ncbi:hypothetical protein F6B40_03230 [Microbacterium caowuchunii]|uniref:Beta-xylosidase C-terminal Concanavalin A-like domain-containing protein n=1 Tax=Microbacterium caowuchunii TaxID=2614638 RepID=A0A5N0TLV7_9MICO|nr:hypothetical protein F6B40_03230 [Microbacterium caowuchunii]